jgi:homoserine O-acetyltransferase
MSWDVKSGRFALGALDLQSGETLRNSELSWKSFSTLAPAGDNVIVYPTSYSAQHTDLEWLIGPDGVLDPTRWFIVIPDMFGNGLSSSPSTVADYPALVTTDSNCPGRGGRRLHQSALRLCRRDETREQEVRLERA